MLQPKLAAGVVAVATLFVVACGQTASPTAPTPAASLTLSSATSGLKPPALAEGVTDLTLAKAGWTCIQPGNSLTLCAPPGLGLPPIPPTGGGRPTYNIVAFTLDHEFVHHVKLLRPDLYHGEPCLGGDPWTYLAFLDYYECIIPAQG